MSNLTDSFKRREMTRVITVAGRKVALTGFRWNWLQGGKFLTVVKPGDEFIGRVGLYHGLSDDAKSVHLHFSPEDRIATYRLGDVIDQAEEIPVE